jgi:hypothetical protein
MCIICYENMPSRLGSGYSHPENVEVAGVRRYGLGSDDFFLVDLIPSICSPEDKLTTTLQPILSTLGA